MILPEPHPLDFDWRYTRGTVVALASYLPLDAAVLAIGAPSIARHLSSFGRKVILVDRQPLQDVEPHIAIDIDHTTKPFSGFTAAIVDPPWYVPQFRCWTAWAAQSVGIDGHVLATIWPQATRPSGEAEIAEVFDWLGTWGQVERLPFRPVYQVPIFEKIAEETSSKSALSTSPRNGILLKIVVKRLPEIPPLEHEPYRWLRWVFNNYQLALRLRPQADEQLRLTMHPDAVGWTWPFVSRRAPGLDQIDLWSSHNEVAVVSNPGALRGTLERLSNAVDDTTFIHELAEVPTLVRWDLPRPPYRRVFKWSHRQ